MVGKAESGEGLSVASGILMYDEWVTLGISWNVGSIVGSITRRRSRRRSKDLDARKCSREEELSSRRVAPSLLRMCCQYIHARKERPR